MKKIFIIYLFFAFSGINSHANDSEWKAYWKGDYDLKGFKDSRGVVQIEAKFQPMTRAVKFKNIIAAQEYKDGKYENYYLLKDGTRIGNGQVYIFDSTFDCESENKIMFSDKNTKKVGYFNGYGEIEIPAIYSQGSSFVNGYATVIKDATRTCHDGSVVSKSNSCEHWSWKNGQELLINSNNEILIENFQQNSELDFFSLRVSTDKSSNPIEESFLGVNNKYYSFINFEKYFEQWLFKSFLKDINQQKMLDNSFDNISLWNKSRGWFKESKEKFIRNNFETIISELKKLRFTENEYFVMVSGLSRPRYNSAVFDKYFDSCDAPLVSKYPVIQLFMNHVINNKHYQNSFSFLKTESGFKFISMSYRTGKLKYE